MTKMLLNLQPGVLGKDRYHANEILKGSVSLLFEHPKEVKSCYIIIKGSAKCKFSKKQGKHSVSYHGNEVYLNTKTYLHGSQDESITEIPAGLHKYSFECLLPPQIPASFRGQKGEITYFIEAVLDVAWRLDKEIKTFFNVVRLENLNEIPRLLLSMESSDSQTFCCFCYCTGSCKMIASIPHTGFSPGSFIPVKIYYNNQSIMDVDYTHILLKRITTFTGESNAILFNETRSKIVPEVLFEISAKGSKKGTTQTFQCDFQIPEDTPHSDIHHCSVIKIEYFLKVKGVSGCFHTDLKVSFPIQIGATGIGEPSVMERLYRRPQPSPLPIARPSTSMPSAPLFVDDEDLPPTFEEAVGTKKTELKTPLINAEAGWNVKEEKKPSAPELTEHD